MKVHAIVNAANTELQMGGGVCGAIFKAAGESELQAACDKLAPIKTGDAVITPGFRLSANISSMLRGLSTEATIAVRKNSYAFAT